MPIAEKPICLKLKKQTREKRQIAFLRIDSMSVQLLRLSRYFVWFQTINLLVLQNEYKIAKRKTAAATPPRVYAAAISELISV
jgi:hypothetical protein